MGDTTDDSSEAAPRAQDEGSEGKNRGFMGRLFSALSGQADTPDTDPDKPHFIYPQPAMPGMRI